MKRRTKQRMTAIHVSIPVRILEDFDQTLRFNQSRSKKITMLMAQSLLGDTVDLYSDATLAQIIRKLVTFEEIDDTLASLLLQILTKSS
jgi:metal-responsive CopG/Arc/MetJ family transcriptional regulator